MDIIKVREYWLMFAKSLGLDARLAHQLFKELEKRYTHPHRHYHGLTTHVGYLIEAFQLLRTTCKNPIAVELALWTHDACYRWWSKKNEENSIQWMIGFARKLGVSEPDITEAARLIGVTCHCEIPRDYDAQLVADLDLMILGRPRPIFIAYENWIRREYWFYFIFQNKKFCTRRAVILNSFLRRKNIYNLFYFQEKFERVARENLTWSIQQLQTKAS